MSNKMDGFLSANCPIEQFLSTNVRLIKVVGGLDQSEPFNLPEVAKNKSFTKRFLRRSYAVRIKVRADFVLFWF